MVAAGRNANDAAREFLGDVARPRGDQRVAHLGVACLVAQNGGDFCDEGVGVKLRVVDTHRGAGRDEVGGVEPLFAVAVRQRHVDRRQAGR